MFVLDAETGPLEQGLQRAEGLATGFQHRTQRLFRTGVAIAFATAPFYAGIQLASTALNLLEQGVISFNDQIDASTDVFAKFRGSVAAGRDRVNELFEIAKKTPFDFQGVLKGATTLETLGNAALASKENLTLFGDAAAGTVNITGSLSSSIERTTFWTARLYNALQSGAPIGEAALRLQELGLITDQTRKQLELAVQAGANPDQLFGVYLKGLERFKGLMEAQQKNFGTQISTLKDNFTQLSGLGSRPLFEGVVSGLIGINKALESSDVDNAIKHISDQVDRGIKEITRLVNDKAVRDGIGQTAKEFLDLGATLVDFGRGVGDFAGPVVAGAAAIIQAIDALTNNSGLKIVAFFVLLARFRREAELAFNVIQGRVNLFDPVKGADGSFLTGRQQDRRNIAVDVARTRRLLPQIDAAKEADAAADRALTTARQRQSQAQDDAQNAAIRANLSQQEAAQAAARVRASEIERAAQKLQTEEARQNAALVAEARDRVTIAEREYGVSIRASEAAEARRATASAAADTAMLERKVALAKVEQARQALEAGNRNVQIGENIFAAEGGRFQIENRAAVEAAAQAQVNAARSRIAKASLAVQANPGAAANQEQTLAIAAYDKAVKDSIAVNTGATEALRVHDAEVIRAAALQKAYNTEVDAYTKVAARETAATTAASIAQREADAAQQVRLAQRGIVGQARGDVARAAAVSTSPLSVFTSTAEFQRNQQAASGLTGNHRLLTSSIEATAGADRKLAAAAAEVETKLAAKAKAAQNLVALEDDLGRSTTTVAGRFAAMSQTLGIVVIAMAALNQVAQVAYGQSLPQLIGSLIKYGDAFEEMRRKIRSDIQGQNEGDPLLIQQQIADAQRKLNEAQNKLAEANRPMSVGEGLSALFLHPTDIRDSENAIRELTTRIAELQAQYDRATSSLRQYSDEEYKFIQEEQRRRAAGQGTFIGPLPTLPKRTNLDTPDTPKLPDMPGEISLLPAAIRDKLTKDVRSYEEAGKQALVLYLSAFKDPEQFQAFSDLRTLLQSKLQAALGDRPLSIVENTQIGRAEGLFAKLITEVEEYGHATTSTIDEVKAALGVNADAVLALADAYAELRAASQALAQGKAVLEDLQNQRKAAQDARDDELKGIQDKIDAEDEAYKPEKDRSDRRIRDLQDKNEIEQAGIEAIRKRQEKADDEFTRRIKEQTAAVDAAKKEQSDREGLLQAAMSGTMDMYLLQIGATDELTKKLAARYEAELGGLRRVRDATQERSTSADRETRRQLLAFDEQIAAARERGDRAEAARLGRLRQQFQTRAGRDQALASSRAGVAQDNLDTAGERIGKEGIEQAKNDQRRVTAEQTVLDTINKEKEASDARFKAEIDAAQARVDGIDLAIKEEQRAQRNRDDAHTVILNNLNTEYTTAKKRWDKEIENLDDRITQQGIIVDGETAIELAAKNAYDSLVNQNKALDAQYLAWKKIIDLLQGAGLLPKDRVGPTNEPVPGNVDDPAQFGPDGKPKTPAPAPVPSIPPTAVNPPPGTAPPKPKPGVSIDGNPLRVYADGTFWYPEYGSPPPGYTVRFVKANDGKSYPAIYWAIPTPAPPPPPPPAPSAPGTPPPGEPGLLASVAGGAAGGAADGELQAASVGGVSLLRSANVAAAGGPSFRRPFVLPTNPAGGSALYNYSLGRPATDLAGGTAFKVEIHNHAPTIGTAHIREEADVDKLAAEINRRDTESFRRVVAQGVRKETIRR